METLIYNRNLRDLDLKGVDWKCADLKNADLENSNLSYANLSHANLTGACLNSTLLCHTNLSYADFKRADLKWASLIYAHLKGCCFKNAVLYNTKFIGSDLRGADFTGCDTRSITLTHAITDGAIGLPGLACPENGSFIGWKKCFGDLIVKLEVPSDAKRSSALGKKCRCSKAKVLEIQYLNGEKALTNIAYSSFDRLFIYKIGEIVEVPDFDDIRWNECSTGIHFFMDRADAVDY